MGGNAIKTTAFRFFIIIIFISLFFFEYIFFFSLGFAKGFKIDISYRNDFFFFFFASIHVSTWSLKIKKRKNKVKKNERRVKKILQTNS